jgi:hypothetical protein
MKQKLIALAVTGLTFGFAACDKKAPEAAAPSASSSASTTPAAAEPAPAAAAAPAPAAAEPAPAPAGDSKAAFIAELDKIADEVTAIQKEGGNPMDLMKKLPAILGKLEAIPTTGLPEDVATAFGKVVKDSKEKIGILSQFPSDLPSDPAAIPAYMQAHPEVAKTMMELQGKMAGMAAESQAVEAEFKAAAEKNGMDVSKFLKAGQG